MTSAFEFGNTVSGRPLVGISNSGFRPETAPGGPAIGGTLLLGGIHGDEPATVRLLETFADEQLPRIPEKQPVLVVPCCNPDGWVENSRYNARGVDLNRNFPHRWSPRAEPEPPGPAPLSEPESRALEQLILTVQPRRIVSLHWALAELDADGAQSENLLHAMWNAMHPAERAAYRCRTSTGCQPPGLECPGSLGQWCGFGLLRIWGWAPAMVTLELPTNPLKSRPEELDPDHLQVLRNRWGTAPERYLREASPGVFKMLLAACRVAVET